MRGGSKEDMSPERINKIIKKLPPFRHDVYPEDEIKYFQ